MIRPKVKYYHEDKPIMDFFLKTNRSLSTILHEFDAEVVPFPIGDKYRREGNYCINGRFYYVLPDGTTLHLLDGYLPTFKNEYHWLSDKEFSALENTIKLFGHKSLSPHLYGRYQWQCTIKDLNEISRRTRLSVISSLKRVRSRR